MKNVTVNSSNEVNESEIATIVAGILESGNANSSFDVIDGEIVEYTADTEDADGDSIYWNIVNINWSPDGQSILSVDIDC